MNHLTTDQIRALSGGKLTPAEKIEFLNHLQDCEACMDAYLKALEQTALPLPPRGLPLQILDAALPQNRPRQFPRIIYLAASAAAALCLWLSGTFSFLPDAGIQLMQTASVRQVKSEHFEARAASRKIEQEIEQNYQKVHRQMQQEYQKSIQDMEGNQHEKK